MAFLTLPTNAEERFAEYLAERYEGDYPIIRAFRADSYIQPLILVKAGEFSELAPNTHLFTGNLSVAVVSQIDDAENPVAIHDETLAEIYGLLADLEGLKTFVNGAGGNFHLWGFFVDSYDQDRSDRALISTLELTISCQTLEV